MLTKQLKPVLEAILFLQHKPISISKLAETIDETLPHEDYQAAIDEIIQDYSPSERGVELANIAGGYLFRTKVEHSDLIRRMNSVTPVRMSQAMLEVLSIIAFYQPVTREKLEEIRGVECGHHLRNLMDKKLVRMVGRSDAVGKPMLYGTTKEFLELFGLPSLKEMPPLQEIEEMLPQNEVGEAEDEENRIRSELQAIVEKAEILGFADIEQEEMRLFQGEAQVELKNETETKSREEVSHAAGTERSQAGENSSGRTPFDDSSAQDSEAGETQLQQDEVAGTISFGSISAAQEAEWESDEPICREEGPISDNAVERTDAEAPEGDIERRHYESTES